MGLIRDSARTLRTLLDAGHAVLTEEGPARLTMDAVVKRSGLSKGSVLHHFGTKEMLACRLLEDAIDHFDNAVALLRGDDRSPGSYTRAYIGTTLASGAEEHIVSLQGIVELARSTDARALFRDAVRRWSDNIEQDGLDATQAQLLRLAADGLWWCESANAHPLDPALRAKLALLMMNMAR